MKRLTSILLAVCFLLLSGAAFAQTYRVGLIAPLSGDKADRGGALKNAATLFVEQFNAKHLDTQLELVVRNDFNDPEKAVAVATEMVKDPTLLAVIGHYDTRVAAATSKVFAEAQIPYLSPNVSSSHLAAQNKWVFVLNLSDEIQGGFMAVYAKEVLKRNNVLLFYNTEDFGLSMRDAFMKKAANIGLNVQKMVAVDRGKPPTAAWMAQQLPNAADNAKFGMVVALTHSDSGLKFLPLLRDMGVGVPVLAANTWSSPKFLNQKEIDEKYTKDVYVTSPFLWEIANQKAAKFAQSYQYKFEQKPSTAAAMTFDAMTLFAHALETLLNANSSPTRANLRDTIASIDWGNGVEGATGVLFFKNARDKTSEYIAAHEAKLRGEPAPVISDVPAAEQRVLLRDVFVSHIKDGRFKVASMQLLRPREEYVLRELEERMAKGYVMISDHQPYHLVDVVFVGVDVVRINDINIKDMQWDVDVFMWFKWAENRLDPKEIEKIGVINSVKEQSMLFKENLSGPIKYRVYRKRLTLTAPYDLSAFPFDEQVLPMSIAHINKNSTHVMLVVDSRHMDTSPINDIKPREWDYLGRNLYSDLYRYESTFGDPDYRLGAGYKSPVYFSTVNLEVGVRRMLKPYLYTFFLPLTILLSIILLVLWVPLEQFAPRINASISGLVGILVYHMSQKNAFPKVGYTMMADYYFLLGYAQVVTLIICIIYTQSLMSDGQKELAKKWNKRFSLGALVVVIGVYTLVTLAAMYYKPSLLFSY